MDEKRLVSHKRQGRTFIYTPRYSRQRAASRFLEHVFDGAMDQLVLSMISTANPNSEELKQLERIVADARRRKQGQENRNNFRTVPIFVQRKWDCPPYGRTDHALDRISLFVADLLGPGEFDRSWRSAAARRCCAVNLPRRLRIIELSLAGCLIVPWLGMIPGYPRLAIAWLHIARDCPNFRAAKMGLSLCCAHRRENAFYRKAFH